MGSFLCPTPEQDGRRFMKVDCSFSLSAPLKVIGLSFHFVSLLVFVK